MTKTNKPDTYKLLSKLESDFGDSITISDAITIDGVLPQWEAAPRTEESALELVKWCGRNNVAFIARGGGTKVHIGAQPLRCDLVISTRHLNAVIEHDEGNATVQAQSGIALDQLEKTVGEHGQFVPLDWSTPGAATLGGVVATNHFSATKMRCGAPRDLVVGLHAMLSDGRHVKAGSKVVKNVSGYDLNKLFVGSFGTLGLLTQVTIRLRPNDAQRKHWGKKFASWSEAEAFAQQILNGPFEPAVLQVVAQGNDVSLWARFDGGETSVNSQFEKLPATELSTPQELAESNTLELRAILPLTRASAWGQNAQQAGATRVLWDCGLGVARAEFAQLPENAAGVIESLRESAVRNEGSVVVERAPEELKTPELVWGKTRSDFALMQTLKKTFDAANVCAPGRSIGGI